jgi:hypothetical protein
MGFIGRVLQTLTGQAKKRLPTQLEILGAPSELVERARGLPDTEQERLFSDFALGRCACALDWKADGADVVEELTPLLTEEEKRVLASIQELPDDASLAIVELRNEFRSLPRTLIQTESFGDFSFLVLVPRNDEQRFLECVGPWLIVPGSPGGSTSVA